MRPSPQGETEHEYPNTMEFLPVFMNLRGRQAHVVGGGEVAERKAGLLLEAGAEVTVVSPELVPVLQKAVADGTMRHRNKRFEAADLDGAVLVIAATDDEAVNRQISQLAQARNLPVNVVDNP